MLTKRIYLKINLSLVSPLCVSNGGEDNTDKDVILDFEGKPFVPATSLCGGMRAYLPDNDTQNKVFGYIEIDNNNPESAEKSFISPVTVYDLEFNSIPKISIRDGVGLDDDKIAKQGAKYEYEIIETGVKASFRLELKLNENNEKKIITSIKNILFAIDNGDIRFGHKKNRGLGQFKITDILVKKFTKDSTEKWYEFNWNNMESCKNEWFVKANDEDVFRINIPLKLKGGISIRQYSAKPNEPDYSHITCNGEPIIPGSSWAGAILHRANDLLKELDPQIESKELLNEVFGYVDQEKKEAKQSDIVISESILEDSKCIETARNSINRFDASTIEKALYTEKTYVGGNTNLVITIKNKSQNLWAIGLIYLVLKDLKNGFLSIGGLASIGRGIFEFPNSIEDYSCYLTNLAVKIREKADRCKS